MRWAIRTGDSSVGLIVVLEGSVPIAARDGLYESLVPAGAKRVRADTILSRSAMDRYLGSLDSGAVLPQLQP